MSLTAPFALVALCALALVGFVQLKLIAIARQSTAPQAPRVAAAILAVAGLGATGLASLSVAGAAGMAAVGTAIVEHGPVRRVTVERAGSDAFQEAGLASSLRLRAERSLNQSGHKAKTWHQDPSSVADFPLQLTIDWEGDVSPQRVRRWLDKEMDIDAELINALPVLDGGRPLTRLKFGVRLSRHEQSDLEDLTHALDLPASISFEVGRR